MEFFYDRTIDLFEQLLEKVDEDKFLKSKWNVFKIEKIITDAK